MKLFSKFCKTPMNKYTRAELNDPDFLMDIEESDTFVKISHPKKLDVLEVPKDKPLSKKHRIVKDKYDPVFKSV